MTYESQVVAGPLAIYLKAWGGGVPAMPAVNRSAADLVNTDGYTLLGRRGADSLKREGVVIEGAQEHVEFMGANSLKVTDRWRTKDELVMRCTLVDLRLEMVALALDQTVVEDTTGSPDHKTVGLGRPRDLKSWTVLARGRSPYANAAGMLRQYFLYACNISGPYSETNALENPTEIPFEFRPIALHDASLAEHERFGRLRAWSGA